MGIQPGDPVTSALVGPANANERMHDADEPEPSSQAFLLVLAGENVGHLYMLDGREHVIGRSKQAAIRVNEKVVSQQHARLSPSGSRHRICDLGSTNGTFVNDRRVEDAELRTGDVVQVGETIFTYLTGDHDRGREQTVALQALTPAVMAPMRERTMQQHAPAHAATTSAQGHVVDLRNQETLTFHELVVRLVQVVRFFKRYAVLLLIFAVLGASAGVALAILRPPAQPATFELSLTPASTENPIDEQSTVEYFVAPQQNFLSQRLIAETLHRLESSPPPRPRIAAVRERLQLENVAPNVYVGTYTDEDPDFATRFLEQHLQTYLDTEIEKTLAGIRKQVELLRSQVEEHKNALRQTEIKLRDLKENNIEALPDQSRQQFDAIYALESRSMQLAADLQRLHAEAQIERDKVREEAPMLEARVAQTSPYQSKIADINRRIVENRSNGLGPQHPDMIALEDEKRQLEALSASIVEKQTTDVERKSNAGMRANRSMLAQVQAAENAARAELGRVNSELAQARKIVSAMPEVEAEYANLMRSYEATRTLYDRFFQQLKTYEIKLDVERASAAAHYEILAPVAAEPISMVQTMVKRGSLLGLVGVFLGLLVAAIRELRRYARTHVLGRTSNA